MIQSATPFVVCVSLFFGLGCPQTLAKEKQPTYVCHTATGPMKIDGQLDEPAWKHAQIVTLRYPFRPVDATNLPMTTARLLWDKNAVYLAWQAEDIDI